MGGLLWLREEAGEALAVVARGARLAPAVRGTGLRDKQRRRWRQRNGEVGRHGGCHLWKGKKGGSSSKLTRRELAFAGQCILHGLWQAAEIVGIREDVGISW